MCLCICTYIYIYIYKIIKEKHQFERGSKWAKEGLARGGKGRRKVIKLYFNFLKFQHRRGAP